MKRDRCKLCHSKDCGCILGRPPTQIAPYSYICEYEDNKGHCKKQATRNINVANYETIRVCDEHAKYFLEAS